MIEKQQQILAMQQQIDTLAKDNQNRQEYEQYLLSKLQGGVNNGTK